MIKPAIQGVLNVLKACSKSKTVKRVILTSSAAAVSINNLPGTGLVVDEKDWTNIEFLTSEKPPTWVGYLGDDASEISINSCLKSMLVYLGTEQSNISGVSFFRVIRPPRPLPRRQLGSLPRRTTLTLSPLSRLSWQADHSL